MWCARHAPSMAHESPRSHNPSLCHLAAGCIPAPNKVPRSCAALPQRPARAARACAPSLACRLVKARRVARGFLLLASNSPSPARWSRPIAHAARRLNCCAVQADRDVLLRCSEGSNSTAKSGRQETNQWQQPEQSNIQPHQPFPLLAARCCRLRLAPCSPRQGQAGCAGRCASLDPAARGALGTRQQRSSPIAGLPESCS
jgi:hypothetical protein